jgi:hypothetical protein
MTNPKGVTHNSPPTAKKYVSIDKEFSYIFLATSKNEIPIKTMVLPIMVGHLY